MPPYTNVYTRRNLLVTGLALGAFFTYLVFKPSSMNNLDGDIHKLALIVQETEINTLQITKSEY